MASVDVRGPSFRSHCVTSQKTPAAKQGAQATVPCGLSCVLCLLLCAHGALCEPLRKLLRGSVPWGWNPPALHPPALVCAGLGLFALMLWPQCCVTFK